MLSPRYEIRHQLGQGSFARTFLATDREHNRSVAIKVLLTRDATDWKAFELFEREATVLRSLRHHGVPEIFDSFRDSWEGTNAAFLVMEYIEGTSLAEMIESHAPVAPDGALNIFVELLGILEYLHRRVPPVLHRDIKPANIVVRPNGYPALVDFGSVRNVFLSPDETSSTIVGTYGYMPYEQYMGQASPSSDLYATGATMLHFLTGRPPKEFMNADGRIEVPNGLPGGERLQAALVRMLRPSPAERFASAHDVRTALLSSVALVPATSAGAVATTNAGSALATATAAHRKLALLDLPPAPRELTGVAHEQYKRLAHNMWQLMEPNRKPGNRLTFGELGVYVFFSALTAGVLPITFYVIANSRRRRLKHFFTHGAPAVAEILAMEPEDIGFGVKHTRVRYEFVVDGVVHRDSDLVLPAITDRWRIGDQIQILHTSDGEDMDSVVVSAG